MSRRVASHLLVADAAVTWAEVLVLADARFPAVRVMGPSTVRLAAHTTLTGPVPVPDAGGLPGRDPSRDATTPSLAPAGPAGGDSLPGAPPPASAAAMVAFVVETLRERAPAAPFAMGDADGMHAAFGGRVPLREEGRAVSWLIAAARRLGGWAGLDVGGADSDAAPGTIPDAGGGPLTWLKPDPLVNPDLETFTDIWLTPAAAVHTARSAGIPAGPAPVAAPATSGTAPGAAPATSGTAPGAAAGNSHRAADAAGAPRREQVRLEGYAITAEVHVAAAPAAAMVCLEVGAVPEPPTALRAVTWLTDGGLCYALRYYPSDPQLAAAADPAPWVARERAEAAALIDVWAGAVIAAVGGVMLDADGFVVDPADLLPGG